MPNKTLIMCLAKGHENIEFYNDLRDRTRILRKQFASNDFEFAVFHEGNISTLQQEHIASGAQYYSIEDWWKTLVTKHMIEDEKFKVGYRKMCAFYSYKMWDYMHGYDYIIRVDADVLMMGNLFEAFQKFKEKDWVFAVAQYIGMNHELSFNSFKNFMGKEFELCKLICNNQFPYTPVTFFKTEFWLSEQVQKFNKKLEQSNICITHRVGDMFPYAACLNMYSQSKKYGSIEGITYKHLSTSAPSRQVVHSKKLETK